MTLLELAGNEAIIEAVTASGNYDPNTVVEGQKVEEPRNLDTSHLDDIKTEDLEL